MNERKLISVGYDGELFGFVVLKDDKYFIADEGGFEIDNTIFKSFETAVAAITIHYLRDYLTIREEGEDGFQEPFVREE